MSSTKNHPHREGNRQALYEGRRAKRQELEGFSLPLVGTGSSSAQYYAIALMVMILNQQFVGAAAQKGNVTINRSVRRSNHTAVQSVDAANMTNKPFVPPPLYAATNETKDNVSDEILEKNISENIANKSELAIPTPLSIKEAIDSGDLKKMNESLVSNGGIEEKFFDGEQMLSPLLYAIKKGQHNLVRELLGQGADIAKFSKEEQYNAVLWSIMGEHASIALFETLLSKFPALKTLLTMPSDTNPPLMLLAWNETKDNVKNYSGYLKIMVEHNVLNFVSASGNTIVSIVAINGAYARRIGEMEEAKGAEEFVKWAVSQGADVLNPICEDESQKKTSVADGVINAHKLSRDNAFRAMVKIMLEEKEKANPKKSDQGTEGRYLYLFAFASFLMAVAATMYNRWKKSEGIKQKMLLPVSEKRVTAEEIEEGVKQLFSLVPEGVLSYERQNDGVRISCQKSWMIDKKSEMLESGLDSELSKKGVSGEVICRPEEVISAVGKILALDVLGGRVLVPANTTAHTKIEKLIKRGKDKKIEANVLEKSESYQEFKAALGEIKAEYQQAHYVLEIMDEPPGEKIRREKKAAKEAKWKPAEKEVKKKTAAIEQGEKKIVIPAVKETPMLESESPKVKNILERLAINVRLLDGVKQFENNQNFYAICQLISDISHLRSEEKSPLLKRFFPQSNQLLVAVRHPMLNGFHHLSFKEQREIKAIANKIVEQSKFAEPREIKYERLTQRGEEYELKMEGDSAEVIDQKLSYVVADIAMAVRCYDAMKEHEKEGKKEASATAESACLFAIGLAYRKTEKWFSKKTKKHYQAAFQKTLGCNEMEGYRKAIQHGKSEELQGLEHWIEKMRTEVINGMSVQSLTHITTNNLPENLGSVQITV